MSSTELPSVPPTSVLPEPAAVRVAEGERLRSVRVPGATLTVRSRPPAREGLPPAFCVHGLGGSSLNWSPLMALLDDAVDSEAVDLPGFGDSPPPDDGDYSITAHARAVIRCLEASGRGPVHLFGNSLGDAGGDRAAAVRGLAVVGVLALLLGLVQLVVFAIVPVDPLPRFMALGMFLTLTLGWFFANWFFVRRG